MCHEDKSDLRGTNVLEYIKWGEKQGFHERPSCRGRARWYDLGVGIRDTIVFPERHQKRFFVSWNPSNIYLNKSFYGVSFKENEKLLFALCLSHIMHLSAELFGRTPGGGGGPLDLDVVMAKSVFILDPSALDRFSSNLCNIAMQIAERDVKSIFEELGLLRTDDYSNIDPDDVSLDKVLPDRRELDRIVCEALGLDENDQLEIYKAVVRLVKNRLSKAGSV